MQCTRSPIRIHTPHPHPPCGHCCPAGFLPLYRTEYLDLSISQAASDNTDTQNMALSGSQLHSRQGTQTPTHINKHLLETSSPSSVPALGKYDLQGEKSQQENLRPPRNPAAPCSPGNDAVIALLKETFCPTTWTVMFTV